VLIVGLVGLFLATLVILAPWYPGPDLPDIPAVVTAPGGIAGQP
jgi:hypothetical protein